MKLFAIYHCYDVDGGFGDAVRTEDLVGIVSATDSEIAAFVSKWNKPRVYDRPYADLYEHEVRVEEIHLSDIATLVPYN